VEVVTLSSFAATDELSKAERSAGEGALADKGALGEFFADEARV